MKTKKIFKISGMDCPSCAMVLEGEFEDKGMIASCSYAKEQIEVEFDPNEISLEEIHKTVQKAGYNVVI